MKTIYETFDEKRLMARQGKEIFDNLFKNITLGKNEVVLLLDSKNDTYIFYCLKYLGTYMKKNRHDIAYVIYEDIKEMESFQKENIQFIKCASSNNIRKIGMYFSVFKNKMNFLLCTDKDTYGAKIEKLIKEHIIEYDEYIKYGLYRL